MNFVIFLKLHLHKAKEFSLSAQQRRFSITKISDDPNKKVLSKIVVLAKRGFPEKFGGIEDNRD